MFDFKPRHQRRPNIKTHAFKIIYNVSNLSAVIKNPGAGIGPVALVINAFIPIVKRVGAFLLFNIVNPGIFPRGLIEMAVNADTDGLHDLKTLPR